ncbi:Ig-like domain-containing protein [Nonomuraea sp. MCN248]|uniref:Ig-like domain-containing protein n=1 Tax=Nonomuraea corallina TaxID=2989783 RepID=A0ABT4SMU2_9ACTN|nr:Ig-like domain-containing protein [Nonomuraea corallina]MDA0638201.1 Ig-like domain-containing protein [Nonomuraea corallina]
MTITTPWRKTATGVALLAAATLTVSCSAPAGTGPGASDATTSATPEPPTLTITPAEGSAKVNPGKRIVVTAEGGALDQVTAEGDDGQIEGTFNTDRTKWVSKTPLKPATGYNVSATAGAATVTSAFTTRKPERVLQITDVTPNIKGEKVGIGMPIMVRFNQPVANKAAVERALQVEAEKPVNGAWRWIDDSYAIYRPAKYWAPNQTVTFNAALDGVKAGKDLWGMKNYDYDITIGDKVVSKVDVNKHMMYVYRNGKRVQTMAISAGKATTREYTTTSGVHLTMERANPVRMISPGREKGDPGYYDVIVDHAVRISNSGEYVHAKNNVWAQGRQNVSHGCINARPDQAKWFYDNFQRGDIVEITGTDRELEWNNGWGFWQMSFNQWKKGSALKDES